MPEGDSVHAAARRMHTSLAGATLCRAEIRVPRFAAVNLAGRTVHSVEARGKHLLVHIDPSSAGGESTVLHLHLKMEGRIHILATGSRWTFPAHTVRLLLATSEVEVCGTELGFLRVLTPAEAAAAVDHLGPDLLGNDWDLALARDNITARGERTIGEALLDQRNLAGLGTVYRAELCFLRGVDPRDPVDTVPNLTAMLDLAHRLIRANVDRPERVTTGDLRRGYRLWVYGRGGKPCRRCGHRIERYHLGGERPSVADTPDSLERIAYSCPRCQPRRGTVH